MTFPLQVQTVLNHLNLCSRPLCLVLKHPPRLSLETIPNIILLLSKEFAILVAIALIIALTFIKPSPANPVEALRE